MRKIEVVDYDPDWTTRFNTEQVRLAQALQETARIIEHIGSTSVTGLAAKPVIDILIEVTSLTQLDALNSAMEALGYRVKGENGIAGRRYFQKGGNVRSHQIHAFQSGDSHLIRHRAFRDYLIAHPTVAAEYGELKKRAALRCNHNSLEYMALKNAFIEHHEQQALAWYCDLHGGFL